LWIATLKTAQSFPRKASVYSVQPPQSHLIKLKPGDYYLQSSAIPASYFSSFFYFVISSIPRHLSSPFTYLFA